MKPQTKYVVAVPWTSLGVSVGLRYIVRVLNHKKQRAKLSLSVEDAHWYCSEKTAQRSAINFGGSVVTL